MLLSVCDFCRLSFNDECSDASSLVAAAETKMKNVELATHKIISLVNGDIFGM